MNYLSAQDAMRYRRLYAALFCCLPIAFLAGALVLVLPPPPPDWLIFVPFAWFVGLVIRSLVARRPAVDHRGFKGSVVYLGLLFLAMLADLLLR